MAICSMSGQQAVVAPLRDEEHRARLAMHYLFDAIPVGSND
jgi:hypothetical protein